MSNKFANHTLILGVRFFFCLIPFMVWFLASSFVKWFRTMVNFQIFGSIKQMCIKVEFSFVFLSGIFFCKFETIEKSHQLNYQHWWTLAAVIRMVAMFFCYSHLFPANGTWTSTSVTNGNIPSAHSLSTQILCVFLLRSGFFGLFHKEKKWQSLAHYLHFTSAGLLAAHYLRAICVALLCAFFAVVFSFIITALSRVGR